MKNPILVSQLARRRKLKQICSTSKAEIQKLTAGIERLDVTTLITLEDRLFTMAEKCSKLVGRFIYESGADAAEETLDFFSAGYQAQTGAEVPNPHRQRVMNEALRSFNSKPFFGDTLPLRLHKMETRLKNRVVHAALLASGQGLGGRALADYLGSFFISDTPVEGGSLFGYAELLLVSEENRMHYLAATMFFREMGVTLVRFGLVRRRNRQDGGGELLNYVDLSIADRLAGTGINPVGVYRLETLPMYPHPRARFYLEPIYEVGFFPLYVG